MALNTKHCSLTSLLSTRERGRCTSGFFERYLYKALEQKQLLADPEIVSPHRTGVSSLSLDSNDGRFLLAGATDATVSIYDLSKWGSEKYVRKDANGKDFVYSPIARSLRVPAVDEDSVEIPAGHSSSLTHVQWYPVDSGAFLSASMDGSILFWDTNRMQPILRVNPFKSTCSAVHLQTTGNHSLIAAGSWQNSIIKLVDVRSGACSHELVGHREAISTLQWSPTSSVICASGSKDGTIRLWDIRKAGGRSCVTVLESSTSTIASSSTRRNQSFQADYAHLRPTKRQREASSNNYHASQSQAVMRSHKGHVSGLQFFPHGHFLASVGGGDGDMLLWDLRDGQVLPSRFVSPGGQTAAAPRRRSTPLCIDHDTIWVGRHEDMLGFSAEGGTPRQVCKGHLHNVSVIERMPQSLQLVTGSQDGMLLTWGRPPESTRRREKVEDKDNW
jgi:DNA excision repair protein ERCC-8